MPTIRLLTSVHGENSPVVGDPGALLEVSDEVADVWADGERAELLVVATEPALVEPAPVVVEDQVAPPNPVDIPGTVPPVVETPATVADGPRQPRTRTRRPR